MLQVAKKHAGEMPLEGTLPGVAAAARVSVSAVQAELQDLGSSCDQLHRLLDSLSASGADAFVEVRHWTAWDSSLSDCHLKCFRSIPCSAALPVTAYEGHKYNLTRQGTPALMIIWVHTMYYALLECRQGETGLHLQEMKTFHAEADLSIAQLRQQLASALEHLCRAGCLRQRHSQDICIGPAGFLRHACLPLPGTWTVRTETT